MFSLNSPDPFKIQAKVSKSENKLQPRSAKEVGQLFMNEVSQINTVSELYWKPTLKRSVTLVPKK